MLWENRHPTMIRLPPLPQRACTKLVHEVMGERATSADVGQIVERSEGNAFFLEELIRAAAERGRPASSRPPAMRPDDLPETIIAVAQARLERLDSPARQVLRAASIFGRSFSLDGVTALVGEPRVSLEAIVASLVEREAIAPSEQQTIAGLGELGFRHALLRHAAYATLTEDDRALGHRLAAQWLERVDEDREIVAMHWLEGGDRTRAAGCFANAGEARWGRAQADDAARCAVRSLLVGDARAEPLETITARIRLLAAALEATRRIDERDIMTGIEGHVDREATSGGARGRTVVHLAVQRTLEAVREVCDFHAVSDVFTRAARALGGLSDFDAAKKLLADATTMAGDDQSRLQTVRHSMAKISFLAGEYGTAVEILSGTLLPADWRERLDMLLILATAVVAVDGREALARGLDFVSRAEALVGASGEDPVAQVLCTKAHMLCFFFAGEHAKAAEAAELAANHSRQGGLRYEECIHAHNAGELYLRLNDGERARVALEASNAIARDIGAGPICLHNDALLAFIDGHVTHLDTIADHFRDAGDRWHELHMRFWLGRLLASAGTTLDTSRARHELTRALELATELKIRTMAEECGQKLAELSPPSDGE